MINITTTRPHIEAIPAVTRFSKHHLLILAVVTVAMLYLYGQIPYTVPPYSRWDLANYRAMAQAAPALAQDLPQPFAYRILGPYLAGILPLPDPLAFAGLTALFSLTLVSLFYLFLCDRGIEPGAALVAALLIPLNRSLFGIAAWDFFQFNDVLALNLLLIALWALLRDRWGVLSVALLLGGVTRETVLLIVPVAAVYLLETGRLRRDGWQAALAVLPGVIVFVLVRLLIPAWGPGLIESFLTNISKLVSPEAWFRLLISPFVPISLVPLIYLDRTLAFFRQRWFALALFILAFAAALFGSNNERLMAPALLVVYWLVAALLPVGAERRWVSGVILLAAFATTFHHSVARFPLPSRTMTLVLTFGALAVVSAAFLWLRLRTVQKTRLSL